MGDQGSKQYWRRRTRGNTARRRFQQRVKAADYESAFRVGPVKAADRGRWTRVNKLTDARPGDIFVYAITREKAGCGSGGSDSGHVMFVMDAPFKSPHPSPASCSRGYTRYKMRIADSSKKFRWAHNRVLDTRSKCKDSSRFGGDPGCGVGAGWIYLWVSTTTNKIASISMNPPKDNIAAEGKNTRSCPPASNMKCHRYALGRLSSLP